ncbi:MAG: hypothetical protein ACPLZY_04590 [Candidatus Norongarragalinales archaeon]
MAGKHCENCLECSQLVNKTAYSGYCKRHKVKISIALAEKMRVCDDWEDEKLWLTVKEV